MANKLAGEEDDLKRKLRWAALLHDIGHGPFSHVSDMVFERLGYGKNVHERIGKALIERNRYIGAHIASTFKEEILKILSSEGRPAYAKSLISGPLDCDKQDYFLRDSLLCGVKYGIFDIDRLHNALTIVYDPTYQDHYLAVEEDSIFAVEQFVLARHYLTAQIYFHKVRLITDQMIVRAIIKGIPEYGVLNDLYNYSDDDEYYTNFLNWDDNSLTFEIMKGGDNICSRLFSKIFNRGLFKRICHIDLSGIPNADLKIRIDSITEEEKAFIEERIAEEFGWDPDEVICYKYKYRVTKPEEGGVKGETAEPPAPSIPVRVSPVKYEELETKSPLYKAVLTSETQQFFDIYAPVAWQTKPDKEVWFKTNSDTVSSIVADSLNGGEEDE